MPGTKSPLFWKNVRTVLELARHYSQPFCGKIRCTTALRNWAQVGRMFNFGRASGVPEGALEGER